MAGDFPSPLPWHQDAWSQVQAGLVSGRLPHGLVLSGALGDGLEGFSRRLAAALLCRDANYALRPCGHCGDCRLVLASTHPDFHVVEPGEGQARVGVDDTRLAVEFAALSASQGRGKCILIPAADALNVQSSNCLLKTLEEPSANTYFLLQAEHRTRLLATIRSRCQSLHLRHPTATEALSWLSTQGLVEADARLRLELADGQPLAALAEDLDALAELREHMMQVLLGLATTDGEALGLAEVIPADAISGSLRLLTSLMEDLQRLAAGLTIQHLRHQSLAEALGRISSRIGALGASRWVSACYACLRRSLSTGLKPEELLDALSLELIVGLRASAASGS